MFADGELEELVAVMDRTCGELGGSGFSCNMDSGPFWGLTLGASGGVLGRVNENLSLRADLTVQYLRSPGPSIEATDMLGARYDESLQWSLTRFWLSIGAEF